MSIRQRTSTCKKTTLEKCSTALTGGAAEAVEQEKIEQSLELLAIWEELPTWQQDNHYILSGYRRASNSYRTSLASLTYTHNESVNIYSHLFGALLALAGILVLLLLYYSSSSTTLSSLLPSSFGGADALAFACFFVGAAACLSMSATYHTISNHSPTVARLGNQLDYAGIVLLIWGSFVASIYYGFACHSHLRLLYWTMVRLCCTSFLLSFLPLVILDFACRSPIQGSDAVFMSQETRRSKPPILLDIYPLGSVYKTLLYRSPFLVSDALSCPSDPNSALRNGGLIVRPCSYPWASSPSFPFYRDGNSMASIE